VLEDGALVRLDWQQVARVLAPKVDGAWLLHALTREQDLDFFVLYSSVASILGSSGQASHAAANAFLDALAHHRRAAGLPALSIGWGVWSEIGSAAARGTVERVAELGAGAIAPLEGLQLLERLLGTDRAYLAVQPIDWTRYLAPLGETPPWLGEVAREARAPLTATRHGAVPAPPPTGDKVLQQLATAPASDRGEILLAHVHEQVLQVIGLSNGQSIDPLQPLSHLGVDSLMAVELRNRLGKSLAVRRPLPATLVFDYPTIGDISGYLAREVLGLEDAQARAPGVPRSADLLEDIESLSEDEVDELFADMARPRAGASPWS
jgi:acyl carrier protein